jgi:Co/Zn/Cd efflux system component
MGFVLASLMGTVASTSKLYLARKTDTMFWIGIVGIVLLALGFFLLMKHLHKKINDLEKL